MSATASSANQIVLHGKVSGPPQTRELPSGDRLVVLSLAVPRPDGSRSDSLPVVVGPAPGRGRRRRPGQAAARTVDRASRLAAGDPVRVAGWLQRRFWAAADGRRSRLQVVATDVDRA